MRQGPVLTMCAVTGAVLVASFSRSTHLPTVSGAPAAPAGVLLSPSAAPRTAPPARRVATRPSPSATRRATHVPTTRATPSPSPRPKPTAAPSVVVNGQSVDTPYGPVQVRITVRNHRIIKAEAIDYPQSGSRDQELNSYAIPRLDDETLQAQSAQIDTVSGATYTSEGYRSSLQSALDSARAAGAW